VRDADEDEMHAFVDAVKKHFDLRIVSKRDSKEMTLLAKFLQAIGIQDTETFLTRYWTTLPFDLERAGPSLYVPESLDVLIARPDRWWIAEVLGHEVKHVHRFKVRGSLVFAANYLGDPMERALEESYAMSGGEALYYWRNRRLRPAGEIPASLAQYGCNGRNIDVATRGVESAQVTLGEGGSIDDADRFCTEWWEQNAPKVRAEPE